jgi:hypothetical protein
MQGSKTDNFVKSAKRSKTFDDGYGSRNNRKQNTHKEQRVKANKQRQEYENQ